MKIEEAWLRIIVSVIVGGIAGFILWLGVTVVIFGGLRTAAGLEWMLFFSTGFLSSPIIAMVLAHALTPRETKDGHTRCGKCGYILKGLTEPRCSECGERI